ncbi:hypothetical protein F4809DRAFT_659948 [Biscogniauxia mediterranea]|nr:hypothetical protein F4809DRAFT_659948 [Biscogniauxia mediterranea]
MGEFKVIIVGAGLAGLTMAHALQLANIAYVVVDKAGSVSDRDSAPLVLMPGGARILHQIGLMSSLAQVGSVMYETFHVPDDDSQWYDDNFGAMARDFGTPTMLFDERVVVGLMRESLCQANIKTGKNLVGIMTSTRGVTARFDDGTVETGSIIVGADGARSTVRRLMRDMNPSKIELHPYTAGYRCYRGYGTRPAGVRPGEMIERHGEGWAIQVLLAEDRSYFIVYERLAEPQKGHYGLGVKYRDSFKQSCLDDYLDVKLARNVTFRDLWEQHTEVKLDLLEQGINQKPAFGTDRMALIGDAAFKITPNTGMSPSCAIESAAALANQLQFLLCTHPEPDTDTLCHAFEGYWSACTETIHYWQRNANTHLKLLVKDPDLLPVLEEMAAAAAPGGFLGARGNPLFKRFLQEMKKRAGTLEYGLAAAAATTQ